MFEAKTQLSELVNQAQRGEKVILTTRRKKTPVAMIVALKPVKERVFDLFHHPDIDIPSDFDELPEAELCRFESLVGKVEYRRDSHRSFACGSG